MIDLATDKPIVTFAVDSVAPIECNQPYYDYEPENGTIIGVQMRVSTSPELASSESPYFAVSGYEFAYIGADGLTVSNLSTIATYSCLSQGEMLTSSQMMPGSQYAGTLVLDVPAPNGTLIYRPSGLDSGGFEWNF